MLKKTSAIIMTIMIIAMVCSMFGGAMAAEADATLTLYTMDGYSNPIGGASFRLFGPDGSAVASAVTGSNGYVVMTISAEDIADTGTTNFTLVETSAPDGYEITDNNWAVTVSSENGKPTVSVDVGGLWDTFYDWIEGSVLTGADFAAGKLTVSNIAKYYDIPECSMIVKGLSYAQMQGYTSEYELHNAAGDNVATGHAIGFAVQEDESYKAQVVFNAKKLPAGTYTITEKSTSQISGMKTDGIAFLNAGKLTVGSSSSGEIISAVYTKPPIVTPPVTPDNNKNPGGGSTIGNSDNTGETDSEVQPSPDAGNDIIDKDDNNEVVIDDEDVPTADSPDNGEHPYIWIIVGMAIVACVATVFLVKNKKSVKK